MKISYIADSHTGEIRNNNEDTFGVTNPGRGFLAFVCDGLGGIRGGEVASDIAANVILSEMTKDYIQSPAVCINNAIIKAGERIFDETKIKPELKGMATTAVVFYMFGDVVYIGSVGDSRCYFVDNEDIEQLTTDHTLAQKYLDENKITHSEALHHPQRNILYKVVGNPETCIPDVMDIHTNLNEDWWFFLCTDGVTDVVSDSEIQSILISNSLEEAKQELSSLIVKRGAPDNFTYIIIKNDYE